MRTGMSLRARRRVRRALTTAGGAVLAAALLAAGAGPAMAQTSAGPAGPRPRSAADVRAALGLGAPLLPLRRLSASAYAARLATPTDVTAPRGALGAAAFVSPTTGWVAGFQDGRGVMLATGDAGRSWTRQELPAGTTELTGVAFTDSTHGWAVGAEAVGYGRIGAAAAPGAADARHRPELVRVGSLGLRRPERRVGNGLPGVGSRHRADPQSGDPTGPLVVHSSDGAQSRADQTVPGFVLLLFGVSFSSPTQGYAVGVGAEEEATRPGPWSPPRTAARPGASTSFRRAA